MANALKTEGKRMQELWTAKSDKKEELKRTNNKVEWENFNLIDMCKYILSLRFASNI